MGNNIRDSSMQSHKTKKHWKKYRWSVDRIFLIWYIIHVLRHTAQNALHPLKIIFSHAHVF